MKVEVGGKVALALKVATGYVCWGMVGAGTGEVGLQPTKVNTHSIMEIFRIIFIFKCLHSLILKPQQPNQLHIYSLEEVYTPCGVLPSVRALETSRVWRPSRQFPESQKKLMS